MGKQRTNYSPEQKVAILKKHLVERVPVSDVCDQYGFHPTVFLPKSNGKIERWLQSLKQECIRPKTPIDFDDARRLVGKFVDYYNTKRLHSSVGYITPKDKLEGKEKAIFEERDRKLALARERRRVHRKKVRESHTWSTCQGCEAPDSSFVLLRRTEGPGLDKR